MRCKFVSWPRLAAALCLASQLVSAEPAAPSCPDQNPTECGRYEFEAGAAAFERGEFATAVERFRAAMTQRPHPVIRFNLALALSRLGKPTLALSELAQVLNDPGADDALKQRAERERRSAEQAQARISFRLADPRRERVELDGAFVDLTGHQELALDAGNHHVRVISNNSIILDQELELSPGERVELRVGERSRRIDVVVVPEVRAAPNVASKPAPPAAPRAGLSPVWFYSGVGATAVLTGLTVWSGLDTRQAYSEYQRDLPELTQSQADARVRSGHAGELRTNLLLTGSLVAGASSAILGIWLVDFSGKRTTSLRVSTSGLSMSGSF